MFNRFSLSSVSYLGLALALSACDGDSNTPAVDGGSAAGSSGNAAGNSGNAAGAGGTSGSSGSAGSGPVEPLPTVPADKVALRLLSPIDSVYEMEASIAGTTFPFYKATVSDWVLVDKGSANLNLKLVGGDGSQDSTQIVELNGGTRVDILILPKAGDATLSTAQALPHPEEGQLRFVNAFADEHSTDIDVLPSSAVEISGLGYAESQLFNTADMESHAIKLGAESFAASTAINTQSGGLYILRGESGKTAERGGLKVFTVPEKGDGSWSSDYLMLTAMMSNSYEILPLTDKILSFYGQSLDIITNDCGSSQSFYLPLHKDAAANLGFDWELAVAYKPSASINFPAQKHHFDIPNDALPGSAAIVALALQSDFDTDIEPIKLLPPIQFNRADGDAKHYFASADISRHAGKPDLLGLFNRVSGTTDWAEASSPTPLLGLGTIIEYIDVPPSFAFFPVNSTGTKTSTAVSVASGSCVMPVVKGAVPAQETLVVILDNYTSTQGPPVDSNVHNYCVRCLGTYSWPWTEGDR